MRASGKVSSGGGGETIYSDPTVAAAVADLAAGRWIVVETKGQLPSSASTFQDALLLGELPEGKSWTIDAAWNAEFVNLGTASGGAQIARGSIARSVGGSPANGDLDSTGISGAVTGMLMGFRVATNDVYLQIRITAAQAFTYNLRFRMGQGDAPV